MMERFASKSRNAGMVDLLTEREWQSSGARMFAGNEDGVSFGAAVKPDGDITGVFSEGKGKGSYAIIRAIAEGGSKLDAFAVNPNGAPSKLAETYHKAGFEPIARVKYDASQMPEDFTAKYGSRDIVFYKHNGDDPGQVAAKYGTYPPPTKA